MEMRDLSKKDLRILTKDHLNILRKAIDKRKNRERLKDLERQVKAAEAKQQKSATPAPARPSAPQSSTPQSATPAPARPPETPSTPQSSAPPAGPSKPQSSAPSPAAPQSVPTRFKIEKTRANGLCSIHALLGVSNGKEYCSTSNNTKNKLKTDIEKSKNLFSTEQKKRLIETLSKEDITKNDWLDVMDLFSIARMYNINIAIYYRKNKNFKISEGDVVEVSNLSLAVNPFLSSSDGNPKIYIYFNKLWDGMSDSNIEEANQAGDAHFSRMIPIPSKNTKIKNPKVAAAENAAEKGRRAAASKESAELRKMSLLGKRYLLSKQRLEYLLQNKKVRNLSKEDIKIMTREHINLFKKAIAKRYNR
jgi:hypothetical protein